MHVHKTEILTNKNFLRHLIKKSYGKKNKTNVNFCIAIQSPKAYDNVTRFKDQTRRLIEVGFPDGRMGHQLRWQ